MRFSPTVYIYGASPVEVATELLAPSFTFNFSCLQQPLMPFAFFFQQHKKWLVKEHIISSVNYSDATHFFILFQNNSQSCAVSLLTHPLSFIVENKGLPFSPSIIFFKPLSSLKRFLSACDSSPHINKTLPSPHRLIISLHAAVVRFPHSSTKIAQFLKERPRIVSRGASSICPSSTICCIYSALPAISPIIANQGISFCLKSPGTAPREG